MTIVDSSIRPDASTRPRRSSKRNIKSVLWGIAALAAITAVAAATFDSPNMYLYNSILLACVGALALNMLMGTAGLVSMGSAAFLASGAFGYVYLDSLGLPSVAAMAVAAVASGLLGIVVGLPALRLRGLELALASIAALFLVLFFARQYQVRTVGAGAFIIDGWFFELGLEDAQKAWAIVLFAVVTITLIFVHFTVTGKFGRALRLIRDHEIAAAALGYSVTRHKVIVFALSSTLIGLQGALTANLTSIVSVDNFTVMLSILYLQMILIGGLDSLLGAIIGAATIVALPTFTKELVGLVSHAPSAAVVSSQIAVIVSGVLVIVFVVAAPDGIAGIAPGLRKVVARIRNSGSSSE